VALAETGPVLCDLSEWHKAFMRLPRTTFIRNLSASSRRAANMIWLHGDSSKKDGIFLNKNYYANIGQTDVFF